MIEKVIKHENESLAALKHLKETYGENLEQLTSAEKLLVIFVLSNDLLHSSTSREVREEIRRFANYRSCWLPREMQIELLTKIAGKLSHHIDIESKIAHQILRLDFISITASFDLMSVLVLPSYLLWIPILILFALIYNASYVSGIISGLQLSDNDNT